jgi:predicted TIM-barrel fold metal-dependent hydrolase
MNFFKLSRASRGKARVAAFRQARQYPVRVLLLLLLGCGPLARGAAPEQILLKDFRPRTIYRVPATKVEKARFPVIDMHTHDYAKTDEQVAAWVRVMDEAGIEKSTILTMAHGAAFDAAMARYKKYPGRFSVWCGFDFTGYDQPGFGPAAVAELERCFKAGAEGVGEMGDKGKGLFYTTPAAWGVHFDDPRVDPLLEKCADLGMPVSIHVADPMWMYEPMDESNDGLMNAYKWRLDNQKDILSHAELMGTLERAAKKHPRALLVACHFANCSYDLSLLGGMFDRCPNLYADISARFAETAAIPRAAAKFYQKYQDRLVYGTDMGRGKEMYQTTFRILETEDEHFYDWDMSTYHWPLYGFGLSDEILKKVYRENALVVLRKAQENARAGR